MKFRDYDTFTHVCTKDDRHLFITDFDSLRAYNHKLGIQISYATLSFQVLLFIEIVGGLIYSYCSIAELVRSVNRYTVSHNVMTVRLLCVSYLIHTVLVFCFVLLGCIILYRPRVTVFKLCEIYLVVSLLSDAVFSIFNYYHILFIGECVVNLMVIKYLKFLHIELNKVNYE
jgi:hypothetical protein